MNKDNPLSKRIPGYGADAKQENRPGVPMESPMRLSVSTPEMERQRESVKVFKRVGLNELTPVFGTAQPPRALSGLMRGAAYKIPEHKAGHWGLLLFADRVDVMEGLLADSFGRKPFIGVWALAGIVGVSVFLIFRRK